MDGVLRAQMDTSQALFTIMMIKRPFLNFYIIHGADLLANPASVTVLINPEIPVLFAPGFSVKKLENKTEDFT
jgi:hypothetical protein